jgi:hypothetical protein
MLFNCSYNTTISSSGHIAVCGTYLIKKNLFATISILIINNIDKIEISIATIKFKIKFAENNCLHVSVPG